MSVDRKAWALEQLRVAVSDRPAHRRMLDDLIAWHEAGCLGGDDAEPSENDGRKGVTFAVAAALSGDVAWAFDPDRPLNMVLALSYPSLRRSHRQAADRRLASAAGPSGTGLEKLMAFSASVTS